MTTALKLTTAVACRVARLNRDRFNEHVASGAFGCAPATIPGRARLFGPDDMIALWLFRELMEEGFNAARAGTIACAVGEAARANPEARSISYVQDYFNGHGSAFPADDVPAHAKWDEVLFSGTDIRKVTTFRIGKLREMIAHYSAGEAAIVGDPDAETHLSMIRRQTARLKAGLITPEQYADAISHLNDTFGDTAE